jgi:hypothetical protein
VRLGSDSWEVEARGGGVWSKRHGESVHVESSGQVSNKRLVGNIVARMRASRVLVSSASSLTFACSTNRSSALLLSYTPRSSHSLPLLCQPGGSAIPHRLSTRNIIVNRQPPRTPQTLASDVRSVEYSAGELLALEGSSEGARFRRVSSLERSSVSASSSSPDRGCCPGRSSECWR